jgi:HAD superfamily hydrolase (TIGR01509 family)
MFHLDTIWVRGQLLLEKKVIKVLLFDMDGVLLDSSLIHNEAYLATFAAFDIEIAFNYSNHAGKSTRSVMTEIATNFPSRDLSPTELTRYKQECVVQSFKNLNTIPLFPEVETVLTELSSSYSIALCTSASGRTVDAFFRSGVNKELFSEIITSEQVSQSKPEPEIYLLAMQKLRVTSSECLVIEDSLAGLISGIASGANVCRIGDANSFSRLPQKVKKQIKNFETLVELADHLRVHAS